VTSEVGDPQITQKNRSYPFLLKAALGKKSYHKARVVGGEVAEDLFERGLCLPWGTAITDEDLNRVVEVITEFRGHHTLMGLNHYLW
jgi:dTDP-4-amino-4,6-dideoxygalactose transaminase